MKPIALVVSTVHSSDDTRIRERLIRTLSDDFDVVFASREPAPVDKSSLTWVPLHGGRMLRNVRAAALLLSPGWDVTVIHDPELIPAASIAGLFRKRPIVFDVHEDLGAQIESKQWVAAALRPILRFLARVLYSLAERALTLTLAETSYLKLFRRSHVVFPNYPRYEEWPQPSSAGDGSAIYVGDTQTARGLDDAVDACGIAGVPLTLIGATDERASRRWREKAADSGIRIEMTGRLPNPESVILVGEASVGLSPLWDVPNYRYSLPSKTLEYLAMGVPVVATDLPGTSEILGTLEAVEFVPAGNVEAMASAIKNVLSDEVRLAAYRQADLVRRRYAWPTAEVLAFYKGLATQ